MVNKSQKNVKGRRTLIARAAPLSQYLNGRKLPVPIAWWKKDDGTEMCKPAQLPDGRPIVAKIAAFARLPVITPMVERAAAAATGPMRDAEPASRHLAVGGLQEHETPSGGGCAKCACACAFGKVMRVAWSSGGAGRGVWSVLPVWSCAWQALGSLPR